ncbi:hypothetical protein [Microlunatus speluncae]|uniref:hypothetical protein n=1 Tax=Microlunatus speluncae TaxID=2594267 RepID=UPI001375B477|nr:hypothetical protein [Microlunatus speluncae]
MPTTRPRIVLTETDELAETLGLARRRWPADADSASRLLLHLVEAGRRAIAEEDRQVIADRRAVIETNAGAGTGLYDRDDLERLREDWPE